MKSSFLITVFLVYSFTGQAQSKPKTAAPVAKSKTTISPTRKWGVGIRLGDPLGITLKRYLSGGKALEFNLGRSAYWGYDYRDGFYGSSKYNGYDYVGDDNYSALSFQAHFLFQKDFPNAKGLQWYWGFGPQLRFKTYQYYYRVRDYYGPGSNDYEWVYTRDNVTNIDFGADALIGLEYHIPNAPLSVFGDVNVLVEFFDDPFAFFGQGGIGIRYNIK